MTDAVELRYNADLILVLDVLGIPWTAGRPSNGREGTILVGMDTQADGRLEELVGSLSELRWRYEPGRRLQLALELPGM